MDSLPASRFVTGRPFLYQGREVSLWVYTLRKERDEPSPMDARSCRSQVRLQETGLSPVPLLTLLWYSPTPPTPSEVRVHLIRWYKSEAKRMITQRLEHYRRKYPFAQFGQVRIKDQKTRWGSCSSKRNLNFNWRLVMAPLSVLDYVVVHELCHLREMNHSPSFWRLVSEQAPDYRKSRDWLRENGQQLFW